MNTTEQFITVFITLITILYIINIYLYDPNHPLRRKKTVPTIIQMPQIKCPKCSSTTIKRIDQCGCIELECGTTKTCIDYHHGEGRYLDMDCTKGETNE